MYGKAHTSAIHLYALKKRPTTVRLDEELYQQVMQRAMEDGFMFSDVIDLLLRAYAKGTIRIGVTQYPEPPLSPDLQRLEALGIGMRKANLRNRNISAGMKARAEAVRRSR